MPKVSVIILTKNRAELLKKALSSISAQSFKDIETVVVNDGSTDNTGVVIEEYKKQNNTLVIYHENSVGIIQSRQEALLACSGELVCFIDDDDEWVDSDKLAKQVKYLDEHRECVVVGGGIEIVSSSKYQVVRRRPETDREIRMWMLLKNPFFTSTVMFRKEAAMRAGGFVFDGQDFAEDYDLWLRMGKLGSLHNFQQVFTKYRLPNYNKERFVGFLKKQLRLIALYKAEYPHYWLARCILLARIFFNDKFQNFKLFFLMF